MIVKMKIAMNLAVLALLVSSSATHAFQAASPKSSVLLPPGGGTTTAWKSPLFSAATGSGDVSTTQQVSRKETVRQEGGPLAFSTKYGALNPYAIYYGLVAIGLGIPWFIALKTYSFVQFVTRGAFDKHRQIPTWLNQVWGILLMRLTRSYPKIVNMDVLKDFYKE